MGGGRSGEGAPVLGALMRYGRTHRLRSCFVERNTVRSRGYATHGRDARATGSSLLGGRRLHAGPVAPEPADGVGEDHRAVLGAVDAFAEDELVVVALLVEGGGHGLVGFGP